MELVSVPAVAGMVVAMADTVVMVVGTVPEQAAMALAAMADTVVMVKAVVVIVRAMVRVPVETVELLATVETPAE